MATVNTPQPTCFVVMGFGKKTDFETGRVLDLDKSYRNLIKPAVEAAGLKCIRADEIVHSGLIDVPMYEQLLQADVVVADLSTSNKNAFYELGIRHALRPFTTVIIAEDGIKTFPFDISHVAVRQYRHMGDGIDYDEVERFRGLLTETVREILKKQPDERRDSPVYTFLKNLQPPAMGAAIQAALAGEAIKQLSAAALENQSAVSMALANSVQETHRALMDRVEAAQKEGNWTKAKSLLEIIREMSREEVKRKMAASAVPMLEVPEDPGLLQWLALATYKSKSPNARAALEEARGILLLLNPQVSNDMETLGLWGSVHKNLWELEHRPEFLDESIRAYERGFYNRGDHYNGINFAYMLNLRAANTDNHAEAIADFVNARRVRREVMQICDEWLSNCTLSEAARADPEQVEAFEKKWFWAMSTKAEALVGLEDEEAAAVIREEAYARAPERWMRDTAQEQLAKLRELLKTSPLIYLSPGPAKTELAAG